MSDDHLWIELAILATILAPTDAALGKAVVSNPVVPSRIREALNVESGLNDGISVPILFLLITLFTAQASEDVSIQYGLVLFAREIGIGLITGLGITFIAMRLIALGDVRNWISGSWKSVIIISLALSCFFLAQVLGGSGFIACFSGGILFGVMRKKHKIELLNAAEGTGEILSLVTWFMFGSIAIATLINFSWTVLIYALISLTLVRIIPVFISLINTGMSFKEKLFIGWFGPRGLASIVFIIIMGEFLPHQDTLINIIVCTVLLSILAHGFSANPLAKNLILHDKNSI